MATRSVPPPWADAVSCESATPAAVRIAATRAPRRRPRGHHWLTGADVPRAAGMSSSVSGRWVMCAPPWRTASNRRAVGLPTRFQQDGSAAPVARAAQESRRAPDAHALGRAHALTRGAGIAYCVVLMTPNPTLLMLPPQTVTTRAWAARLGTAQPALSIVVAEDAAEAARRSATPTPPTGPSARARRSGGPAPLAPGSAGRPARGLLLPGADRAPGGRDELPRDLQRSYRRPHHGLRARLRAGAPPLPAETAPAHLEARAA